MMIDDLQGRLSPMVKWCLAGVGAAGGWHFAQSTGSPIPTSCVVAGATAGFCLLVIGFVGLRLLRALIVIVALLVVANYVWLVPYGYGDHLQSWLGVAHAFTDWICGLQLPRGGF